ncbi:hypothetical protein HOG21_07340 [bacterium]|jgi:hypothetical protein|nr:hypothetical protein [bacterium]
MLSGCNCGFLSDHIKPALAPVSLDKLYHVSQEKSAQFILTNSKLLLKCLFNISCVTLANKVFQTQLGQAKIILAIGLLYQFFLKFTHAITSSKIFSNTSFAPFCHTTCSNNSQDSLLNFSELFDKSSIQDSISKSDTHSYIDVFNIVI